MMKKINRKLATISMIGCMLNSVNVIAAEERVTIGKVDSYSATAVAVKEHATTEKINRYVLDDGTYVEERVVRSTGTIAENIEKIFSALDTSALPSKILLETGALFQREAILQKSRIRKRKGEKKADLKKSRGDKPEDTIATAPFRDLYAGLSKPAEASRNIPSLRQVQQLSKKNFEKHDALPLAISIVNYESLDPEAVEDGRLIIRDGKLHDTGKENYWQSYKFKGAGIVSFGPELDNILQMVIPSDMFLSNVKIKGKPLKLQSATIRFKGTDLKIKVKPDQPFSVPIEALLNDKNTLAMKITVKANGRKYRVNSEIFFEVNSELGFKSNSNLGSSSTSLPPKPGTSDRPLSSKPGFSPRPLPVSVVAPDIVIKGDFLPYCDIDQTVATHAYLEGYGSLNARVYPASTNINDCHSLNRVLVLLDGFDVLNNRTQETLYSDYGDDIKYFINRGYDVVTVGYDVGNDYIQRNGQAFRTFMVDTIPTLMAYMPDTTDVAVLAGSMGGQVANYGLVHAELAGEEHHARLFITLDTEYEGGNIPIGLQMELNFLNVQGGDSETAILVEALGSPAAKQLLKHLYEGTGSFVYAPNQLYNDWKTEIQALELPQMTRNVSIANGSGTGNVYAGSRTNLSHVSQLQAVETVLDIDIDAFTDHNGVVFHGAISLFGNLVKSLHLEIISGAMQDDVNPGSSRPTPQQIAEPYNNISSGMSGNIGIIVNTAISYATGTMTYDLGKHAFVPTASAIGTGFDYSYYEKCNSQHGTITVGNREVLAKELIAMKNGVQPVHASPYSQACGQPEPVACTQNVFWWNSWQESDYISPTSYGSGLFCKIEDVPAGATALINQNSFYLESECHSAFFNDEVTGKCKVTSAVSPDTTYDSVAGELRLYRPTNSFSLYTEPTCPYNTVELGPFPPLFPALYTGPNFNNQYYKICKVMSWLSPVATVDMELVVGEGLFTKQTPAEICPIAGKLKKHGCWMGEVPAGVTPVLSGNQFRYSE
ncbi:MAG: hypothetical protein JKX81_16925 [Arenicella sp.]|nr:hypothetical protein [Arenicella sp.]